MEGLYFASALMLVFQADRKEETLPRSSTSFTAAPICLDGANFLLCLGMHRVRDLENIQAISIENNTSNFPRGNATQHTGRQGHL